MVQEEEKKGEARGKGSISLDEEREALERTAKLRTEIEGRIGGKPKWAKRKRKKESV